MTHPLLYLPNGATIERSSSTGLRILTVGATTKELRGAQPKQWDYTLYLDMYYKHPTVFAAINKIVKTATNTGFDFIPRTPRVGTNEAEVRVAQQFFSKQHDFIGELRRIYRDLLIFGDAYFYIVPDRKRRPVRLKRLAPWTVHIATTAKGDVDFYAQRDLGDPKATTVFYEPHEILHFKIDDPGNDIYGMSPLESLKATIATDLHMLHFQKQFFKNGASMGTFIIVEDAPDEELERVRQWVRDEYVGSENAYKPVILGGSGIKIERGVASHEEMSFLEGRNFIIEAILSVLDVPPAKIGRMETANRSNSKEQDKSFRTESISPLQYTVESILSDNFLRDILGCNDILFKHSESDVRDAQEQMELWKDAVQNGILAINEVRAKMGYPDVDGGEIPFIMTPTGAIPLDRMDLYFKIPEANVEVVPEADRSPVEGEPVDEIPDVTVPALVPANKARGYLAAARQWLDTAPTDRRALRQAYAYLMDALDEADTPGVREAVTAMRKALRTDDDDLRLAYIERAVSLLRG